MAQESPRAAVNQPYVFGKNAREYHARDAAHAVAGKYVERIVNARRFVKIK